MNCDGTIGKLIGSALIVCDDPFATRQLTEVMHELALSIEVCITIATTLDRIDHRKLEVGVIDFALGDTASLFFERIRASSSNRTAVTFAITNSSTETARALKAGANFALERPLTLESIRHTLKAAYGLIVRERRRYFRYPVSVPAVISGKGKGEIFGRTVNISESGMALSASTALHPGSEVTVEFTLDGLRTPIKAECKVRWSNDKGKAGLSFSFLPADSSSLLQGWLARRLQEQLPSAGAQTFQPLTRS